MRSKGEGTIVELPNGGFRAKVTINKKTIVGSKVERRSQALPALWAKIERMEQDRLEKEKAALENPSLSTCVHRKIASMDYKSFSPTTVDWWRFAAKKIDQHYIGQLPPTEITETDLVNFRNSMSVARRTKNNNVDAVKRICRDYGNILKLPRLKTWPRTDKILTEEEQAKLLSLPLSSKASRLIRFGLRSGLRREELAGLHRSDIDGNGVQIRTVVVAIAGGIYTKEPKNSHSEGWVALPGDLIEIVKSAEGYVFGDAERPPHPRALNRLLSSALKGTEFEGLGLHDLRRTYAMHLLVKGIDVKTVSELTRHDPSMLLDLYTKSRRDLKEDAVKAAFGA